MSIALMTLAWKTSLPAGRKMVLLALCDNANDQGECYPSIAMTAEKCSMGERTVQEHISELEKAGLVARETRHGRSNLYRINITPADFAPREIRTPQISHPTPAESAPPPPQISHPTPADFAPITINEPSVEPSKEPSTKGALSYDTWPAMPDKQILSDWKAMRKRLKADVSQTVINSFGKELTKAVGIGFTVNACLSECVTRNWRGFKAEWMRNAQTSGGAGFKTKQQLADERSRAAVDEFVGSGRIIEGEKA